MIAIETHALSKKFKERTAVHPLNLSIKQGQVFGLLGLNGAGKTTTIRMLTCLAKPTSGDATVLGKSILTESQAVKENINLSPQETAVAPNLSVRENLELMAGVYGNSRQSAKDRTEQVMKKLGLSDRQNDKAKVLSGGWQRRLSIAMALISEPKILFLDEPTLGLDVIARRELWSVIENLKGEMTIILTTHYLEEAQALSDEIGIMANGKLKALGTAESMMADTGARNFEDAFIALATGSKEMK
ncbi:MAG: ABC transporter ATP-binding protein [Chloroflexi bacterium CFX2]|nr:ABC transporter ATP-binding protein [Chloroflexi bacterium CFX2]